MDFSEKLKELRRNKAVTQRQVAREIDITERNYQHYEAGTKKPSFDVLIKIANYFNEDVDWLLGRTEERTKAVELLEDFPINREGLFTLADMGIVKFKGVNSQGNLIIDIDEKYIPQLFNDSEMLLNMADVSFERILDILTLPLEAKDELVRAIIPIWVKYKKAAEPNKS